MQRELLEHFDGLSPDEEDVPSTPSMKIPSGIRKQKIDEVMGMLDRETDLVEGAMLRLEKLNMG